MNDTGDEHDDSTHARTSTTHTHTPTHTHTHTSTKLLNKPVSVSVFVVLVVSLALAILQRHLSNSELTRLINDLFRECGGSDESRRDTVCPTVVRECVTAHRQCPEVVCEEQNNADERGVCVVTERVCPVCAREKEKEKETKKKKKKKGNVRDEEASPSERLWLSSSVSIENVPRRSEYAWVIVAHVPDPGFILGTEVLARSLREVGTAHDVVVLASPDVARTYGKRLISSGIRVELTTLNYPPISKCTTPKFAPDRTYNELSFTKTGVYLLRNYRKFAMLDSDILFFNNFDEVFERPMPQSGRSTSETVKTAGYVVIDTPNPVFVALLDEFAMGMPPSAIKDPHSNNRLPCTFQGTLRRVYGFKWLLADANITLDSCVGVDEPLVDDVFVRDNLPLVDAQVVDRWDSHNLVPFKEVLDLRHERSSKASKLKKSGTKAVHYHSLKKPWNCLEVSSEDNDFIGAAFSTWWDHFDALYPPGARRDELLDEVRHEAVCLVDSIL